MPTENEPKPGKNMEKLSIRVLLAEDNQGFRETLVKGLLLKGCEVEAVENGQLLLDRLAVGSYDVVMTDFSMPVVNGYQVLTTIKGTESMKDLPVIVLTTNNIKEEVEEAGGVYLNKNDSRLIETIVEAMIEITKKKA
jgi:CheY-like chemotaxis protein